MPSTSYCCCKRSPDPDCRISSEPGSWSDSGVSTVNRGASAARLPGSRSGSASFTRTDSDSLVFRLPLQIWREYQQEEMLENENKGGTREARAPDDDE